MIGSRRPSAIRLIGFHSAIVLAGSSSRFFGKNADDRKRITNTSGKIPCAMLADLGLERDRRARSSRTPSRSARRARARPARRATPPAMWAPKIEPDRQEPDARRSAPSTPVALSRPSTNDQREIGAATSRSMKPISMSSASAIAALTPASIVDCSIAPASWKSRNPCTCGNCGRSTARPAPPVFTARNSDGKIDDRREELRPAERLLDGAPPERRDHPRLSFASRARQAGRPQPRGRGASRGDRLSAGCGCCGSSSAPSRWRPVFSTKTSSSVGCTRLSDSTQSPASSSARTIGATSEAPAPRARPSRFRPARASGCRSARGSPRRASEPPSAITISRCDVPDLRLRAGRACPPRPSCPRR